MQRSSPLDLACDALRELTTLLVVLALVAIPAFLAIVLVPPSAHAKRPEHVLRIFKSERKMQLEVGGAVVKTYRVGLGGAPVGDKERQGDLKTPEGELYVAWKNAGSSFHRFLGLSYPMPQHAERGHAEGLVTKAEVKRIVEATRARRMPPQDTKLGGWVGIHGGGGLFDWTLGCVAISDDEIEDLFGRIATGDRVVVLP
ncbi:L,D-transpeptidase family protein [Myxococcota bacterium]|nr:L,D-transpeptidase family protein [Myxococcota bacterium]